MPAVAYQFTKGDSQGLHLTWSNWDRTVLFRHQSPGGAFCQALYHL